MVYAVNITACIDEKLHDIVISIHSCNLKWGIASMIGEIQVLWVDGKPLLDVVVFAARTGFGEVRSTVRVDRSRWSCWATRFRALSVRAATRGGFVRVHDVEIGGQRPLERDSLLTAAS